MKKNHRRIENIHLEHQERPLGKILLIKPQEVVGKPVIGKFFDQAVSLNVNGKQMNEFSLNEIKSCKRCGHKFHLGNKYCGNCGLKRLL